MQPAKINIISPHLGMHKSLQLHLFSIEHILENFTNHLKHYRQLAISLYEIKYLALGLDAISISAVHLPLLFFHKAVAIGIFECFFMFLTQGRDNYLF